MTTTADDQASPAQVSHVSLEYKSETPELLNTIVAWKSIFDLQSAQH